MLTLFVSRVRIENVIFFTFRLTFLHLNLSIMSWQSYVDDQLLATKVELKLIVAVSILPYCFQKVQKAVICGHDGNIWAASAGFNATVDELKKIATNYGNMDVLPMSGITVGGIKYMFLSCQDRVMRGKKGTR